MSEENKKCCSGGLKKVFVSILALAALAYGGWFAYAKVTDNPNC